MKQFFHNELQLELEGKVAKGKYFVRPAWVEITKKIFQKLGFKIDTGGGESMTDREFKVKILSSLDKLESNQAVMFKSIDKLESNQAVMFKSIDKLESNQAVMFKSIDKLESNQAVMFKSIDKLESNQAVMFKTIDMVNNKIDILKDDMNNKFVVLDQRISKLEKYHI